MRSMVIHTTTDHAKSILDSSQRFKLKYVPVPLARHHEVSSRNSLIFLPFERSVG